MCDVIASSGTMFIVCFQDLHNNLYESYYFNFISPISRSLLEDLGKAALEANCVAQVSKVNTFVPLLG